MKLISIDPGITTGVATEVDDQPLAVMEVHDYKLVWQMVAKGLWDHVICENFTATFISKEGVVTVRIVGGIEAICTLQKKPLTIQQNIMRLPFKEQAQNLIVAAYGKKLPREHRMDALAHLLRWKHDSGFA